MAKKKHRTAPVRTDSAQKFRALADKLHLKGNKRGAAEELEKVLRLAPKDTATAVKLSVIYEELKSFQKAINVLTDAEKANSSSVSVLTRLGQLYLKTIRDEDASSYADKALEIAPDNADAHSLKALVLQREGRLPDAITHFKTALEIRLQKPLPAPVKKPQKEGFNKPETEALLWDTLGMLAEGGVHAFASHGTLLGLVREGGLLPFDKDLDIGIPFSEAARASTLLTKNGWLRQKGNFGLINPVAYFHPRSGMSLDVCGFSVEKDSGKTIYGFWMEGIPKEWNRIIEMDTLRLEKVKANNERDVWSLSNPETLLEAFYGDWRSPDPEYEGIIEMRGLRGASLLTQCYGLGRLYNNLVKGDKARAARQSRIMQSHLPDDSIYASILEKCS